MRETKVAVCPDCGDRKLVDFNATSEPTMWCSGYRSGDDSHEAFVKMDLVDDPSGEDDAA